MRRGLLVAAWDNNAQFACEMHEGAVRAVVEGSEAETRKDECDGRTLRWSFMRAKIVRTYSSCSAKYCLSRGPRYDFDVCSFPCTCSTLRFNVCSEPIDGFWLTKGGLSTLDCMRLWLDATDFAVTATVRGLMLDIRQNSECGNGRRGVVYVVLEGMVMESA